MSEELIYFAVIRRHGVETPRIFYERIPPDLLRKDGPLVYATRLDEMQVSIPLTRLMWLYRLFRRQGKLPPENRGPRPTPTKRETTISREYWTPPPVTWDRDAPAYPPLDDPVKSRGNYANPMQDKP